MTTSASTNYNATRDQILTRAAQICHIIDENETLSTAQLSQYARALNDILYEFNTDGMPMWARTEYTLTPVAGTRTYTVGTGKTINTQAPLKIVQAFKRVTATSTDSPLLIYPQYDYNLLGNKFSQGTPSILYYDPPRAIGSGGEPFGTVYLYNVPDSSFVSTSTVLFYGHKMLDDFDSATDTLDFPQYFINAVVWATAEALAYEGAGLPFAERSMISKMADKTRERAESFMTEEGSVFFRPEAYWEGGIQ